MITRPINIGLTDWADQLCLDLDSFGLLGRITDEDWQLWGSQLLSDTRLGRSIPNPYAFDDWRVWGERLCETLA